MVNVVMSNASSNTRVLLSAIKSVADMLAGSEMSSIWTLLSESTATAAYVFSPIMKVSIPIAPSNMVEPSSLSIFPVADMLAGSETSIIWTPSSLNAVTAAYVFSPIVNMDILRAPSRTREPVSVIESVADMLAGSETSIIWTPSSLYEVTATYVFSPIVNVATSIASSNTRVLLSVIESVAVMVLGVEILII